MENDGEISIHGFKGEFVIRLMKEIDLKSAWLIIYEDL